MLSKKKISVILISLFAAIALMGCGSTGAGSSDDSDSDTTAPTVTSTSPADTATGVAINTNITATFSEAMDSATIVANFTLADGANAVSGTVTYDAENTTAIFAPDTNLVGNTSYTVTITTGATDLAGNQLAADKTWAFTTGASEDATAPTVNSTSPADSATGVAINSSITATFSEGLNSATIVGANFMLKRGTEAVIGTVSYADSTATFSPATELAADTEYTATITTDVADLAGNQLAAAKTWTFTTGATADSTAPTVTSTSPADGATGVAVSSNISATFDEAMDLGTITGTTFTLKQGDTAVTGTVSYVDSIATFNPAADLSAGTEYTGTVTTGASDLVGNQLAADKTWTFTTAASDSAADTTAPTVTANSPADAATDVAINTNITATFSEGMDSATIVAANFTLSGGETSVSGTVSYEGSTSTATFNPAADLTAGTEYTATITTGATDAAGNALAQNKVWTFTTVATVPDSDTTAPTVTAMVPMNGATDVAIDANIAATFSEEMDSTTIVAANFTLSGGGTTVAGTVSYEGSTSTATFNPTDDLDGKVEYTATITTGATDAAGNALTENKVWTFTTVPSGGPTAVNLGTAGNYAILAKSGVSTTGTTMVTGDIGLSPESATSLTGFSVTMDSTGTFATSAYVTGKLYAANYTDPTPTSLTTAIGDMETAYTAAAGLSNPDYTNLGAGEIGGQTLEPGLYKWGTGVSISTDVTIWGSDTSTWVFQIAEDLVVANGVEITLAGGALAENIVWQVGSSASLGTTSHFEGTVLAKTNIPVNTDASVNGRLLSQTAVTLDANAITEP